MYKNQTKFPRSILKEELKSKFAKILSSVMFQEKQVIFFNKIKKNIIMNTMHLVKKI